MITVFKDASTGMPRWVAVTSNAYRDRDGEIVSSEALKKAVAYGDSTQERGPLRFWHVPGLDIGTTDFKQRQIMAVFLLKVVSSLILQWQKPCRKKVAIGRCPSALITLLLNQMQKVFLKIYQFLKEVLRRLIKQLIHLLPSVSKEGRKC